MRTRKGFTIVELVVVIAVIAILAAVLIPSFSGVVEKTDRSTALKLAEAAYKEARALALEDYNKNPIMYSLPRAVKVNGFTYVISEDGSGDRIFSYPEDGSFKYQIKIENKKVSLGEKLLITNPNGDTYENTTPATGVEIHRETLTLEVGQTEILYAAVQPANAKATTVEWEVTGDTGAIEFSNGHIRAVAQGSAIIRAKIKKSDNTYAYSEKSCTVTVNPVSVNFVTLDKLNITLDISKNETATLTATAKPENAEAVNSVAWESSNVDVAIVSNGIVMPVGLGSAVIKATVGGKFASCGVTVNGIVITNAPGTLVAGDTPYGLNVVMKPEGNIVIESNKPEVVRVEGNMIHPVAEGVATITAKGWNFETSFEINVTAAPVSLDIDLESNETPPETSVSLGGKIALNVTNANGKNVTWESQDENIAKVYGNIVTAVGTGTTTVVGTITEAQAAAMVIDEPENGTPVEAETIIVKITVTASNVPEEPEKSTYTVTKDATNATIIGGDTVVVGESYAANIKAADGYTIDSVTVTMDGNIVENAYNNGMVTIGSVTGDIVITVTTRQTEQGEVTPSITLDKTVESIAVGGTVTITATVNLAESPVTWSTSDDTIATVVDGVVTGVATGTTIITATAGDISAACTVTVTAADSDSTVQTYSVRFEEYSDENVRIIEPLTATEGAEYTLQLEAEEGYIISSAVINMKGYPVITEEPSVRCFTYTIAEVCGEIVVETTTKHYSKWQIPFNETDNRVVVTDLQPVGLSPVTHFYISYDKGKMSGVEVYICDENSAGAIYMPMSILDEQNGSKMVTLGSGIEAAYICVKVTFENPITKQDANIILSFDNEN